MDITKTLILKILSVLYNAKLIKIMKPLKKRSLDSPPWCRH